MIRRLLIGLVIAILAGASLNAHHSYAMYDREHPVTIEGDIERVAYENPHTILTVRTTDAVYTLEWGALFQLQRWNVPSDALKAGDHVIVTGSALRDRSQHQLSLLREIRRPSDGWRWARDPQNTPASGSR